jgi:hypothetical protein
MLLIQGWETTGVPLDRQQEAENAFRQQRPPRDGEPLLNFVAVKVLF